MATIGFASKLMITSLKYKFLTNIESSLVDMILKLIHSDKEEVKFSNMNNICKSKMEFQTVGFLLSQ